MGSELQRRHLGVFEQQRGPTWGQAACYYAGRASQAACFGIGYRYGGRAGAVIAREVCRDLGNMFQPCKQLVDYFSSQRAGRPRQRVGNKLQQRGISPTQQRYLPLGNQRALSLPPQQRFPYVSGQPGRLVGQGGYGSPIQSGVSPGQHGGTVGIQVPLGTTGQPRITPGEQGRDPGVGVVGGGVSGEFGSGISLGQAISIAITIATGGAGQPGGEGGVGVGEGLGGVGAY